MTGPTYLRIGRGVYPVYGDALRGWSPRPDDLHGPSAAAGKAYRYGSIDELFFALVNLCAAANAPGYGDARRGH
jgi:hypothetical protein